MILWHLVEPLLRLAVDVTPDKLSTDNVLQQAHEGVYGIWVIIDEEKKDIVAAAATRMVNTPRAMLCALTLLAAENARMVARLCGADEGTRNTTTANGRRIWSSRLGAVKAAWLEA